MMAPPSGVVRSSRNRGRTMRDLRNATFTSAIPITYAFWHIVDAVIMHTNINKFKAT